MSVKPCESCVWYKDPENPCIICNDDASMYTTEEDLKEMDKIYEREIGKNE